MCVCVLCFLSSFSYCVLLMGQQEVTTSEWICLASSIYVCGGGIVAIGGVHAVALLWTLVQLLCSLHYGGGSFLYIFPSTEQA